MTRSGTRELRAVVSPDEFLGLASQALDWNALLAWIGAIEARLALPVPVALFKMALLERWFDLNGPELDDACHARVSFRRFLGAPLHGPVAEVWMYRQLKPRLALAEEELGRLFVAAERLCVGRGLPIPNPAWLRGAVLTDPHEDARTTLLDSGRAGVTRPDPGRVPGPESGATSYQRDAVVDATAVLLWPWGSSTPVDRLLAIGRDPGFSPFARQLWADPRISRRHAEVAPQPQGVAVCDLGSANGTYLDGRPLAPNAPVHVREDAALRFGTSLTVKLVFLPPRPHAPL